MPANSLIIDDGRVSQRNGLARSRCPRMNEGRNSSHLVMITVVDVTDYRKFSQYYQSVDSDDYYALQIIFEHLQKDTTVEDWLIFFSCGLPLPTFLYAEWSM